MTPALPRQARRCTVYPWCLGHSRADDPEHQGAVHVVPAEDGRALQLRLCALRGEPPRVSVELIFDGEAPAMLVTELEDSQAIAVAAALRQLAVQGRERVTH
jgi:hypothetical protein